jgi:hypothetical protein
LFILKHGPNTALVTGVGANPVPVRFAFRYYVTDGGPSGSNSDLIGIDTFSIDRPTLSTNDVALNEKAYLYIQTLQQITYPSNQQTNSAISKFLTLQVKKLR